MSYPDAVDTRYGSNRIDVLKAFYRFNERGHRNSTVGCAQRCGRSLWCVAVVGNAQCDATVSARRVAHVLDDLASFFSRSDHRQYQAIGAHIKHPSDMLIVFGRRSNQRGQVGSPQTGDQPLELGDSKSRMFHIDKNKIEFGDF